jgi:hypothetical protein
LIPCSDALENAIVEVSEESTQTDFIFEQTFEDKSSQVSPGFNKVDKSTMRNQVTDDIEDQFENFDHEEFAFFEEWTEAGRVVNADGHFNSMGLTDAQWKIGLHFCFI